MIKLISKFKNRTEKFKRWRNRSNKLKKQLLKLSHVVRKIRKKN